MKLSKEIRAKALAHAKEDFPRESIGLVCLIENQELYFRCNNQSEDPEHSFVLSPVDYLKCSNKGKIIAVIHSHPNAEPNPSGHDIKACERGNAAWFIVNPVTEEWGSCEPSKCKA